MCILMQICYSWQSLYISKLGDYFGVLIEKSLGLFFHLFILKSLTHLKLTQGVLGHTIRFFDDFL